MASSPNPFSTHRNQSGPCRRHLLHQRCWEGWNSTAGRGLFLVIFPLHVFRACLRGRSQHSKGVREGGGKESDVGCGLKAGAAHRLSLSADQRHHLRCRSYISRSPPAIRPHQEQLLREITFHGRGASHRAQCQGGACFVLFVYLTHQLINKLLNPLTKPTQEVLQLKLSEHVFIYFFLLPPTRRDPRAPRAPPQAIPTHLLLTQQ